MTWENPVDLTTPPGGGKDQILVKQSGADHDVAWANQMAPATEFKGAIPSSADLATVVTPSPGDTYVATDSGHLWVWGGLPAQWNEIGSAVAQLPGPVRFVHDDAERIALTGLDEGTLVVQEDSDAVWQWRQGSWKMLLDFVSVQTPAERDALSSALLPGSLVNVRQEGSIYLWTGQPSLGTADNGWLEILDTPSHHDYLQAQVFDPEMPAGHQLHWFDMRSSMEVVPSISDLSDRAVLPASHMVRGKLVYVHGVGRIYELRTETTALTNTQADWQELGTAVNPPGLEASSSRRRLRTTPAPCAGRTSPQRSSRRPHLAPTGSSLTRRPRCLPVCQTWPVKRLPPVTGHRSTATVTALPTTFGW